MRVFESLLAGLALTLAAGLAPLGATAGQSQMAQAETPLAPPPAVQPDAGTAVREPAPSPPQAEDKDPQVDLTQPDPDQSDDGSTPDNLSIGDIPVIETVELTPDTAKKALDVYYQATEKYESADLESYDNLQDFVDQNPQGKAFEADVKAAGFAKVNDWNTAFTAVGFAYAAIVDDQTADVEAQIAELEADKEIASDMKSRMIASLKAMIPSDNNKKIIEALLDDPVYGDKLRQLDLVEE